MLTNPQSRTAAAQARFRIDAPNSQPRFVKLIALDPAGEAIARTLMRGEWTRTSFHLASAYLSARPAGAFSVADWLEDLRSRVHCLVDEIDAADVVVMVSRAGDVTDAASIIGEACLAQGVTATALVLLDPQTSDAQLAEALSSLRPFVSMLVVARDADCVRSVLDAFGA